MLGSGLLNWLRKRRRSKQTAKASPSNREAAPRTSAAAAASQALPTEWPPARIEVTNTVWGPGYIFPGGELETLRMAKPMQLSGESTILLLGAGAGGPGRSLSVKFGSWVTAMETSSELVVAATELAMKANLGKRVQTEQWNPAEPELRKRYYNHCIAFEPLRGARPEPLLTALAGALKSGGHLAMMELVADGPLDPADPTVMKWGKLEHRPATVFPSEIAVTRILGRLGFDVRIAEDATEKHIHDGLIGWRRTLKELETRSHSLRQIAQFVSEAELWLLRLRLMESGRIRLVRWHAIGR